MEYSNMTEFSFRRLYGPTPAYKNVVEFERKEPGKFTVIAGPCSVESEIQIHSIAKHVSENGATHLRGGIFRAGTYPGANFGLIQQELITAYYDAAKKYNLLNIIEVLDYRDIDFLGKYSSCFQVGCRQMQNYTLLKEVGMSQRPVFLKRHPGATLDEFLGAAEHVLKWGCKELYLIERGSVSHVNHVRWDLSISMIPAIHHITQIPVIVDASHGTGRRDLVGPMTLAGVAAGADGILIETHPNPLNSISDADQALSFDGFKSVMRQVRAVKNALIIEEKTK